MNNISDKLYNGKWLLSPTVHTQMCKKVDKYLSNPAAFENTPEAKPAPPSTIVEGPGYAIITISGVLSKGVSELEEKLLGMVDVDWINAALDMVAADSQYHSIILNWKSPGGETTGIEELGRKIVEIDKNIKPVYSWVEDQADSAAYWLCSQAREIGMTPSAQVAGVGVYMLVLDLTKKMEMDGEDIVPISSGKYKMVGHEFRKLTKEEKDILQADVNSQHEKFKEVILSRRPNISQEDMEGLSYNGEQAFQLGFVDILTDSLDLFIYTLEKANNIYIENMKPTVEKKATSPMAEVKAETKVETKKLSFKAFVESLKRLMGDYDGTYQEEEVVPGVPGTAEGSYDGGYEKKAKDHEEPDADDKGGPSDDDEDDMCECSQCKGTGKMKKAKDEVPTNYTKKAEEEEEEEEKLPVKAEAASNVEVKAQVIPIEVKSETKNNIVVEDGKLVVKGETPQSIVEDVDLTTQFKKLCGLPIIKESEEVTNWKKMCATTFNGKLFDTKE